ncbi:VOC family protein [Sphingobium fluviale]|uniref:VOC family protein n=1 Tax=Sphingobium fluviale TaxID=2506423 RepID=A0A4Q1KKU4_9SPHN|nr:VOC family protein [Sphingobium fluviale]RXR30503.1 VOC family protein [Sphingobium fluviale]
MLSDFGQPHRGIIQTAYVVENLRASVNIWHSTLGVGPWFVADRLCLESATYRGLAVEQDIAVAMAFSGHTLFELIQPLSDGPSVYHDIIEASGYGFHHVARASVDFDADIEFYAAQGHPMVFQALVPTGSRIAYVDTVGAISGFTELIEYSPLNDRFFTQIYKGALGWEGDDPVRSFDDLA